MIYNTKHYMHNVLICHSPYLALNLVASRISSISRLSFSLLVSDWRLSFNLLLLFRAKALCCRTSNSSRRIIFCRYSDVFEPRVLSRISISISTSKLSLLLLPVVLFWDASGMRKCHGLLTCSQCRNGLLAD